MRLSLPTPKEMVEHLDRFVRGQTEAKRALAKAVYYHYLKLADPGPSHGPSAPEHCLVVGPTGSGKTLLGKTLASYLGVPVFFVDASSLTSEGYVGESVGDMLARLTKFCDEDPFKLERAIVYLDEIDKCAKTGGAERDIRGEMVQHELLTVLDGNSLSRMKDATKTPSYSLDSSKLLLVASGAFSGIEKIVAKRSGKDGIGFSSTGKAAGDAEKQMIPVEGSDIIEFGFIPELVGRFANVVQLNPLTVGDLTEILKSKEQSPLTKNQALFELHGVSLTFTEGAMRSLAEKVLDQKKGARGLRQAVNDTLRDLEWRLPEMAADGTRAIEIDEDCVMGLGEPKLHAHGNAQVGDELRARRERIFNREYFEQLRSGEGKIGEPSVETEALRSQAEENGEMQRAVPTTLEAELLRHAKERLGYKESWRGRDAWEKFEKDNGDDPSKPLEFANSLLNMGATLDDLYAAMMTSKVQTTGALLRYIAFTKALQDAEARSGPVLGRATGYTEHMAQRSARNIVGFDTCTSAAKIVWLCVEHQLQGDRLLKFADELVSAGVRSVEQLLDLQAMAACPFAEPIIQYVPFWSKKLQEKLADGILTPEIKKVYEPGTRAQQPRGKDPLERHHRLRNAARRLSIERLFDTFPRFATEYLFTSLDDFSEIRKWGRPYSTGPDASEVDRDPHQSFPEAAQQWVDTLEEYPGEIRPVQRDAFVDIIASDLNRALLSGIRSGMDLDVHACVSSITVALRSAGASAAPAMKALLRWLPPASAFSSGERARLYEILEDRCDGTTRSEWEASPYQVVKSGRVSRLARRRGEIQAEPAPSLEPSIAEWWAEASLAPIVSRCVSRSLEDEMRASGIGMVEMHTAHLASGSPDLWACFEYARYSRSAANGSGSRRTVTTMRTSKEGLEPAHLSARERLHFDAASPAACAF